MYPKLERAKHSNHRFLRNKTDKDTAFFKQINFACVK